MITNEGIILSRSYFLTYCYLYRQLDFCRALRKTIICKYPCLFSINFI